MIDLPVRFFCSPVFFTTPRSNLSDGSRYKKLVELFPLCACLTFVCGLSTLSMETWRCFERALPSLGMPWNAWPLKRRCFSRTFPNLQAAFGISFFVSQLSTNNPLSPEGFFPRRLGVLDRIWPWTDFLEVHSLSLVLGTSGLCLNFANRSLGAFGGSCPSGF